MRDIMSTCVRQCRCGRLGVSSARFVGAAPTSPPSPKQNKTNEHALPPLFQTSSLLICSRRTPSSALSARFCRTTRRYAAASTMGPLVRPPARADPRPPMAISPSPSSAEPSVSSLVLSTLAASSLSPDSGRPVPSSSVPRAVGAAVRPGSCGRNVPPQWGHM